MKVLSVVAALAAGLAGAIIWALVVQHAQIEIGYLAWGIGVMVGLAVVYTGGGGQKIGALCALITLTAIFLGKMGGAYLLMPQELDRYFRESPTMFGRAEVPESEKPRILAEARSPGNLAMLVKDELGLMDIIFGLLGMFSAYGIAAGSEPDTKRKRATPVIPPPPSSDPDPTLEPELDAAPATRE